MDYIMDRVVSNYQNGYSPVQYFDLYTTTIYSSSIQTSTSSPTRSVGLGSSSSVPKYQNRGRTRVRPLPHLLHRPCHGFAHLPHRETTR